MIILQGIAIDTNVLHYFVLNPFPEIVINHLWKKTNIKGLSVQQLFHIQTEDMKTPLETKGTILHFNNLLFLQSNLSFLLSGHLLVAKMKKNVFYPIGISVAVCTL